MWDYPCMISNFLILLIFVVSYLSMPRLRNRRNQIFVRLLILLSANALLSVCAHYAHESASALAAFLLHLAYCALLPVIAYGYLLFIVYALRIRPADAPRWARASMAAALIAEAVTLSSVVTGAVVHWDPGAETLHGPLYPILNLCFIGESVISLRLIRKFSDRLTGHERFSAAGAQIALLAGSVLHLAFPSHVITSTATLLAAIALYLAFENPNLYMAHRGNAFNVRALREVLDERLRQKSYRLLAFVLRDYIDMRGIYGGAQMDEGVSMIGQFLVMTYPEYQAFYLRSGRFALLGPETMDWEQVRAEIAERFQSPWKADNAELDLSVTFVEVEPETGLDTVDKILNYLFLAFDKAGETASERGELLDAQSIRAMDRQVEVKRSLDRCLDNNEVEIFLQPLIDSRSRNLAGAEVLSRIRDESGKLISPAVFVPIAEQNGRINLMGEQVLEKTCQFVRDNDLEKIGLLWINVNLSPIQCMKRDLSERFSTILEQYGVSTEIIHLEITEQTVMDLTRLDEQIRVLQKIGFRFSLDDYGSGYSNLSRVKQYPFANIKLDMGIVWDYIKDKDVLLPTIVQAFKQMGFSVTAEGIENAEMADAMSELGCDYLQGYYFSKPLPVDEFVRKYTLLKAGA